MKKRLTLLIISILGILLTALPVYAKEEDFLKDYNCVLPIELVLAYEENEQVIRNNFGVLVGNNGDNGIEFMIVNNFDIVPTEDELNSVYEQWAVEEDKRDSVRTVIRVVVEKDVKVEANVKNVSQSMNLAVLDITNPVFNHQSVVFDIDEGCVKPAQEMYILDNESTYHSAYAVNETEVNGIKYVQFDSSLDWEQSGQALFNENEEFLGLIQNSVDGIHKNALSSKEIVVVLKTLGVNPQVADHTIKEVEKQTLIAATDVADKLDLTLYTEETSTIMSEQIKNARSVIISEEATQEDVDAAYEALLSAQDGLMLDDKMDTLTLVMIIVAGTLALGIIIFVIITLIRKKKKKKKEKEAKELEAKKAPTNSGPYVPANKKESSPAFGKSESLPKKTVNESTNLGHTGYFTSAGRQSEKLSQIDGFAPSSKAINFNEDDTTVLSVVEEDEVDEYETNVLDSRDFPYIVLKDTDAKVYITRRTFVIGKSEEKADYVVNNKSVSRTHLSILVKESGCYAMDMSSLNGSYINGRKLDPQEEYVLNNEDVIKIADVEMTFYADGK